MRERSRLGTALAALAGIVLLASCQIEKPAVKEKGLGERPGPAGVADVEPLGPVEFFFISDSGPVNLEELDERQRAELAEVSERLVDEGGLSGSVARLALQQDPGESELGRILWKRVIYHLNLERQRGFFDVSVQREFASGQQTLKRWVIVIAGGDKGEQLEVTRMDHPDPAKPHKYKLSAKGSALHLIAHYENGALVQDPSLYTSTPESCIDVFFVDEPVQTAILEYDSAVDGPSDITDTCFGRCTHPGIFATH